MAYATIEDLQKGFRTISEDEQGKVEALLEEAAVIIDAYNYKAGYDAKMVASCRMIRRALGEANASSVPIGATQGTVSALGYSQSWTFGSGSTGELYLGKVEKKLLGVGNRIGSYSPVEGLVDD